MNIIATDDERAALAVLTDAILRALPEAQVHGFQSPREALAFAGENRLDAAFLDIEMREMNGVELAKRLKELQPKVNIVFVTGYSDYMDEAFYLRASGYVQKPATPAKIQEELENLRYPVERRTTRIYARTFGNFELYVDDAPVLFGRSKAKELLALLIDRKGAAMTRRELAAAIFEEQEYTRAVQDHLNKVIRDMVKSLEGAGAAGILRRGLNSYAVDPEAFGCDRYDYERPDAAPEALNRFQGEYMAQYSWGESTLAELYWNEA